MDSFRSQNPWVEDSALFFCLIKLQVSSHCTRSTPLSDLLHKGHHLALATGLLLPLILVYHIQVSCAQLLPRNLLACLLDCTPGNPSHLNTLRQLRCCFEQSCCHFQYMHIACTSCTKHTKTPYAISCVCRRILRRWAGGSGPCLSGSGSLQHLQTPQDDTRPTLSASLLYSTCLTGSGRQSRWLKLQHTMTCYLQRGCTCPSCLCNF